MGIFSSKAGYMARPRKGVTFDNADYIFWYIKSAFQEQRLLALLQREEQYDEVVEQFNRLSEVPYCLLTDVAGKDFSGGRLGVDPYGLDIWVVQSINPKGWQRILSAFRQHRHARRHLKTSLKLDQEV